MEMIKEIGLNSIVAQAVGLVAADMDGEKVMLNIKNGNYYGLDSIGSHIWDLFEKPHSIKEVVSVLVKEYDVEENTCENEILTFLQTLYVKGLVDID